MALRASGFVIIQTTTPAEDPVTVGYLWADTANGLLKQCTGVSPYVWTAIGPFNGSSTFGALVGETTITTTGQATGVTSATAILRCNNSADLTINGITAGYAGQKLTIVSVGSGNVFLAHQSGTETTAANRIINYVANGLTPLAAGVGKATVIYDATTGRWRLDQHEQGDWITPAFNAGVYTGGGSMTVTVASDDQVRFSYYLQGRILNFGFQVNNITTGGTAHGDINVALPGSYTAVDDVQNPFFLVNNGTFEIGRAYLSSATTITINRPGFVNWTLQTDNTFLSGFLQIPVA